MRAMAAISGGRLVRAVFGGLWMLVVLAGSGTATAAERVYIFTENYPPYNEAVDGKAYAHKAEDITGICTDMVKAMMARTDFDFVMKMRAWSYAYKWVQEHENHGLFCTARTKEREDQFQWVGPLASINWTLFAAPGSTLKLASLEDARKLKIGGYKGDVMSDYLIDQGFNVTTSISGDVNARRLSLGEIDLWVTDGLVGPKVAKEKYGIEGLRPVLVFRETPMYLAMSKQTDPAVVAKLQKALDAARKAGEIDQINARYQAVK